jgi:hypothetical protein
MLQQITVALAKLLVNATMRNYTSMVETKNKLKSCTDWVSLKETLRSAEGWNVGRDRYAKSCPAALAEFN